MSLDVYLYGPSRTRPCVCSRCDNAHEAVERAEYYSANITHNLGRMAREAGIYTHLWRPDEIGIVTAGELVEPLRNGLERLRAMPEHFRRFNAPNGWGRYENFVPWVENYLRACAAHPEAKVEVSR